MFNQYKTPTKPSASTSKSISLDVAKPLINKMLAAKETGLTVYTESGHETRKDMLRFRIGHRIARGLTQIPHGMTSSALTLIHSVPGMTTPAQDLSSVEDMAKRNFSCFTNEEIDHVVEFLINHNIHCTHIKVSDVFHDETGGHFSQLIGYDQILEFKGFTQKNQLIDALNQLYPSPDQVADAKRAKGQI